MSTAWNRLITNQTEGFRYLTGPIVSLFLNRWESYFRSIFENETFFEIVTKKTYDEVRNFGVTEWTTKSDGERRRKMAYEFPKTIAFSRHEIRIEQVSQQTRSNFIFRNNLRNLEWLCYHTHIIRDTQGGGGAGWPGNSDLDNLGSYVSVLHTFQSNSLYDGFKPTSFFISYFSKSQNITPLL